MKKNVIILSVLIILLVLGILATVLLLVPRVLHRSLTRELETEAQPVALQPVDTYLEQSWPAFRLRSWDANAGTLELDCPWPLTYVQMRDRGAANDFDGLVAGQVENLRSLVLCLQLACGVTPRQIHVRGLSEDGREVYTADLTGLQTACWHS